MAIDRDRDAFRALDAAAPADRRRSGARHATVLLIGKVRRGAVESACLVHDLSRDGMMARFAVPPTVGDRLDVEIRGLPAMQAIVRWACGPKAGLAFTVPQDIARVFAGRDGLGLVARAPRFALAGSARLGLGDSIVAADLLDISAGGAKLRSDAAVERGQAGRIVIGSSTATIFGSVCWTSDDRFGIRFVAPLPLTMLAALLDLSSG